MRSFKLAFTVTLVCGMSAGADATSYRAWGPQRPMGAVRRAGFHHAQTVQQAGCTSGCDSSCNADYGCDDSGCGCDACGDGPCDPWCGCGPCACPDLLGGLIHHIGSSIQWLLCCHHCGGYCGGTCGDPCCDYDSCGEPCGAGGMEEGPIDLVPTPTENVPQQSNPFKDDTVSVVPRAAHTSTSQPPRSSAARRPAVIRSAYSEPIRQLPKPRSARRSAGPSARAAAMPGGPSGRSPRRLQRGSPRAAKPAVQKAEILESLKRAIQ